MVSAIEARKTWARHYITQDLSAPAYGTPEWLALPDGPAKVAACVRAAECWAMEGDEFAERVLLELENRRLADKQAEDAEFVARGHRHASRWTGRGFRPDPAIAADVQREWRDWVGDRR